MSNGPAVQARPLRAPAPNPAYDAATSERLLALIGVDPRTTLDKLRDAQRETTNWRKEAARLSAELASYEARFGYPSHWEHERKALLSRLSSAKRASLLLAGKKPTEGELSEYAHGHEEYRTFLTDAKTQRERMESLRADLVRVNSEIETARGAEVYFERHARLNDSLVYMAGKEMGL